MLETFSDFVATELLANLWNYLHSEGILARLLWGAVAPENPWCGH